MFVFHEPNRPSSGMSERVVLAVVLARNAGPSQLQALPGMIGSLVASAHPASVAAIDGPKPGAAGAEPAPDEKVATI